MSAGPDSYANIGSLQFIDELYEKYRTDPQSVEQSWRYFFEGMEFGAQKEGKASQGTPGLRIYGLIHAYRAFGHLIAKFNPIDPHPVTEVPQLDIENLGFDASELGELFPTLGLLPEKEAPLQQIIDVVKETYCGMTGIEYLGLQRPNMEKWLQEQIEPTRLHPNLSLPEKKRILNDLNRAELFETFLHTKYVGQKRFSIEGGETLIPVLHTIVEHGAELGIDELVMGMAHRGRLNVLANVLNKSYANIFHEFQDTPTREAFEGTGDVKYHKGFSANVTTTLGKQVHLSVTANPSHLESVDPVVEGQVRAKQVHRGDDIEMHRIAPILIHGDAALAGQGVVYEALQLYRLPGYGVGGTIHIVINNQIGFTTLPRDGRSTRYCTDIARSFSAPVFHVNGEDPEGCVYAAKLAVELRQRFHCDVFIDINCYRKYGHNEADEPAFTQPLEYQMIRSKKSPRVIYRDQLISHGVVEKAIAESLEANFVQELQAELEAVQTLKTEREPDMATEEWHEIREANESEDPFMPVDTTVSSGKLKQLAENFCRAPEGFTLHRKMQRLVDERKKMIEGDPNEAKINWGMGEHLAFATLLAEGTHVRLSGQDCRRGTFNHRHAMWMDQLKEAKYFPLNHLTENQGRFDVFNSPLSEFGVLAFEFGYSISYPSALVLWEAQFGDFANGAQVVIDQYICSAEQKWGRVSGLIMLLPHAYEGQGPEHSSARIERFLQLAGDNNLRVVNPSTPAQMFHLLRRQVVRKSRKPLIIFTPKSLLGNPRCVSSINEFTSGSFQEIIDDPMASSSVKTVVFCSGHAYYDLLAEREKRGASDVALIRVEQLYPFHKARAKELIDKYRGFQRCIWAQEEPNNMGPWDFVRHLLRDLLVDGIALEFAGRQRSASPATGSPRKHKAQLAEIHTQVFGEAE